MAILSATSTAARVNKLSRKQMIHKMMPLLQQKLLGMVASWELGDDVWAVSERELKVMNHLVGVLDKLMALEVQANVPLTKAKPKAEIGEVGSDIEPIRDAIAARIGKIIDAQTLPILD